MEKFDPDLHFKKDLFYELKKTRPLHTIINRIILYNLNIIKEDDVWFEISLSPNIGHESLG